MLASQFSLCAVSTRPLHSLSCRSSVNSVSRSSSCSTTCARLGARGRSGSNGATARRREEDRPDPTLEARRPNRLRFLPFDWPDIICALPAAAVQQWLDDSHPGRPSTFSGWKAVKDAFELKSQDAKERKKPTPGFKPFLFASLQLKRDDDTLVAEVLKRSDPLDAEPALHRAINELLSGIEKLRPG